MPMHCARRPKRIDPLCNGLLKSRCERENGIENRCETTVERQAEQRRQLHMIVQQLFDCCGAYGSSRLSTEPHIEGTMKSFVFVQYCINDIEASDTLIRGRSKSSLSRELSSFRRRSFRSAMDCFLFLTSPPARIS